MFTYLNRFAARFFFSTDDAAQGQVEDHFDDVPQVEESTLEAEVKEPAAKKEKKAAAPKKASVKGAKKASGKKAPATKKDAKKAGGARTKKDGLRAPQVRVLAALAKSNKALNRSQIGSKAEVDVASLTEYIGSSDKEKRQKNDEKMGWKSLISLGYVKGAPAEDDSNADFYAITENGKKALEKAKAAK